MLRLEREKRELAHAPLILARASGPAKAASMAAVTTAVGAVACGVCCVLPFALPGSERGDGARVVRSRPEHDDPGEIVGHIMFSPVQVVGVPDLRAMALAPMAVIPPRQRTGIGSALVRTGLEECRRLGAGAVFVVGHPSYYPRFGFTAGSKFGFSCEFDVPDEAFMATELIPDALAGRFGTVHFHEAFRNA